MIATGSGTKEQGKLSATAERFCRRFPLAEIRLATQDFNEANLIGIGGFGKVYKGQIEDGKETVAMKRLATNSNQGEGEFLTEIETLSKLRHVNLVSLIGYCDENGEMILVYEYMPCGTLADNRSSLTWKQLLKLCIEVGRGIDYLHTGTSIIHRDVKSTNILLDENFTAKVSDFGLAKHLCSSDSKSHIITLVKGSFGYLDPSYFTTGRLTMNSDTYAFGVVLLEVLSGRPAVDQELADHGGSLVNWAQENFRKGKVDQIIASNLRDQISADSLKTFVRVAKRCLHHEPHNRPRMAEAVTELQLASTQQERKAPTHKASRFLPFFFRAEPSAIPATQEEIVKEELTFNIPVLVAHPAIAIDESEDQLTVDVAPIAATAIPIHELKDSTNNFSSKCLIGREFGPEVYRGPLKSGRVAAIKMLYHDILKLPEEEFQEQVSIVSNLKHENMAQLLGYCVYIDRKYLAYEFAPNGSLHDILHGTDRSKIFVNGKPVGALAWGKRVKIAIGVAKGLEYVHKKAHIHNNIKTSNILLFHECQAAKIVDFGLPIQSTHYDDRSRWPSEVSWRTDVYSFGIILAELLTGRKSFDYNRPKGEQYLNAWVTPRLRDDKVKKIVDARIKGDYPPKDIAKMAKIAAACLQDAELRPEMSKVVSDLYEILPFPKTSMQ